MTTPARRRLVLRVVALSAAGVVLLALVLLGLAWWVAVDVTSVRHVGDSYPLRVRAVDLGAGTVTLSAGVDADEPGSFRLAWASGQAFVGRVVSRHQGAITRELTDIRGALRVGLHVGVEPTRFTGNPMSALGLSYRDVGVPTGLGPMRAWQLAGKRSTWVILTHGLGGSRADTLPVMPELHDMGFPILAITYRNDAGAPPSPDHRSHLGLTEWRDVAAAVSYAESRGATGVVLYGWSLGGELAELVARDPGTGVHVRGLVLDSPLLDWRAVIDFALRRRHVPALFGDLVEVCLRMRVGVHASSLNLPHRGHSAGIPTLLFQGTADRIVPVGSADAFAREHPGVVTYVRVPGADHVSSIDTDPVRYESALLAFMAPFD